MTACTNDKGGCTCDSWPWGLNCQNVRHVVPGSLSPADKEIASEKLTAFTTYLNVRGPSSKLREAAQFFQRGHRKIPCTALTRLDAITSRPLSYAHVLYVLRQLKEGWKFNYSVIAVEMEGGMFAPVDSGHRTAAMEILVGDATIPAWCTDTLVDAQLLWGFLPLHLARAISRDANINNDGAMSISVAADALFYVDLFKAQSQNVDGRYPSQAEWASYSQSEQGPDSGAEAGHWYRLLSCLFPESQMTEQVLRTCLEMDATRARARVRTYILPVQTRSHKKQKSKKRSKKQKEEPEDPAGDNTEQDTRPLPVDFLPGPATLSRTITQKKLDKDTEMRGLQIACIFSRAHFRWLHTDKAASGVDMTAICNEVSEENKETLLHLRGNHAFALQLSLTVRSDAFATWQDESVDIDKKTTAEKLDDDIQVLRALAFETDMDEVNKAVLASIMENPYWSNDEGLAALDSFRYEYVLQNVLPVDDSQNVLQRVGQEGVPDVPQWALSTWHTVRGTNPPPPPNSTSNEADAGESEDPSEESDDKDEAYNDDEGGGGGDETEEASAQGQTRKRSSSRLSQQPAVDYSKTSSPQKATTPAKVKSKSGAKKRTRNKTVATPKASSKSPKHNKLATPKAPPKSKKKDKNNGKEELVASEQSEREASRMHKGKEELGASEQSEHEANRSFDDYGHDDYDGDDYVETLDVDDYAELPSGPLQGQVHRKGVLSVELVNDVIWCCPTTTHDDDGLDSNIILEGSKIPALLQRIAMDLISANAHLMRDILKWHAEQFDIKAIVVRGADVLLPAGISLTFALAAGVNLRLSGESDVVAQMESGDAFLTFVTPSSLSSRQRDQIETDSGPARAVIFSVVHRAMSTSSSPSSSDEEELDRDVLPKQVSKTWACDWIWLSLRTTSRMRNTNWLHGQKQWDDWMTLPVPSRNLVKAPSDQITFQYLEGYSSGIGAWWKSRTDWLVMDFTGCDERGLRRLVQVFEIFLLGSTKRGRVRHGMVFASVATYAGLLRSVFENDGQIIYQATSISALEHPMQCFVFTFPKEDSPPEQRATRAIDEKIRLMMTGGSAIPQVTGGNGIVYISPVQADEDNGFAYACRGESSQLHFVTWCLATFLPVTAKGAVKVVIPPGVPYHRMVAAWLASPLLPGKIHIEITVTVDNRPSCCTSAVVVTEVSEYVNTYFKEGSREAKAALALAFLKGCDNFNGDSQIVQDALSDISDSTTVAADRTTINERGGCTSTANLGIGEEVCALDPRVWPEGTSRLNRITLRFPPSSPLAYVDFRVTNKTGLAILEASTGEHPADAVNVDIKAVGSSVKMVACRQIPRGAEIVFGLCGACRIVPCVCGSLPNDMIIVEWTSWHTLALVKSYISSYTCPPAHPIAGIQLTKLAGAFLAQLENLHMEHKEAWSPIHSAFMCDRDRRNKNFRNDYDYVMHALSSPEEDPKTGLCDGTAKQKQLVGNMNVPGLLGLIRELLLEIQRRVFRVEEAELVVKPRDLSAVASAPGSAGQYLHLDNGSDKNTWAVTFMVSPGSSAIFAMTPASVDPRHLSRNDVRERWRWWPRSHFQCAAGQMYAFPGGHQVHAGPPNTTTETRYIITIFYGDVDSDGTPVFPPALGKQGIWKMESDAQDDDVVVSSACHHNTHDTTHAQLLTLALTSSPTHPDHRQSKPATKMRKTKKRSNFKKNNPHNTHNPHNPQNPHNSQNPHNPHIVMMMMMVMMMIIMMMMMIQEREPECLLELQQQFVELVITVSCPSCERA